MELIGAHRRLYLWRREMQAPALVRVTGDDVSLNAAAALAWLGFPHELLADTGYRVRRLVDEPAPPWTSGSHDAALAQAVGHAVSPHFRWEVSGFWPTVAEEIQMGRTVPFDPRMQGIVRLLRLESLLDRDPGTLSGGETAKVILAAHLACRPRRLVLDRVLSELDSATRTAVVAHLRDWVPDGFVFAIDDTLGNDANNTAPDGFDWTLDTNPEEAVWSTASTGAVASGPQESGPPSLSAAVVRGSGTLDSLKLLLHGVAALRNGYPVSAEVDCQAEGGDIVLFRGPNGCGKTSLLEALTGLLELRGDVSLSDDGRAIARGQAFALSPQDPLADITEVTLGKEWALACGTQRAATVVQDLGLPARWVDAPLHDDVGLQKLASVVAATLRGRPVCLLDEPTIYLARPMRAVVARAIRQKLRRGGIVVCSTHDNAFVQSVTAGI